MPICPGCERTVSYKSLHLHQQHCVDLGDELGDDARSLERLERRLEVIEQLLEGPLQKAGSTELESRVRDPEQRRRPR
jgi:hypothetical protein